MITFLGVVAVICYAAPVLWGASILIELNAQVAQANADAKRWREDARRTALRCAKLEVDLALANGDVLALRAKLQERDP